MKVYHGTSSLNIDKIKEQGLVPYDFDEAVKVWFEAKKSKTNLEEYLDLDADPPLEDDYERSVRAILKSQRDYLGKVSCSSLEQIAEAYAKSAEVTGYGTIQNRIFAQITKKYPIVQSVDNCKALVLEVEVENQEGGPVLFFNKIGPEKIVSVREVENAETTK